MLPTIVTVNPMAKHRRKRAHHKRAMTRYSASNPFRKHHRHRSKRHRHMAINPFKAFSTRGAMHDITGALVGAAGAVLTDVAIAYLPSTVMPTFLQSGWGNILLRAGVAVGVGAVAGMAVGKQTGKALAAGGLIVVAYSGLKQALAPTLGTSIKGLSGLADFGDYTPAYGGQTAAMLGSNLGAYMRPMGAYMRPMGNFGSQGRLGAYMNPAAFVQASPIRQKQMSGFGHYHSAGGYDSESM